MILTINNDLASQLSKKDRILSILYSFLIFILSKPSFVWEQQFVTSSALLLLLLISLYKIGNFSKIKFIYSLLLLSLILYSVVNQGNYSYQISVFGSIARFGLIFLVLIDNDFLYNSLLNYKAIFSITILISIIMFFLVIIIGIELPRSTGVSDNILQTNYYEKYFLLVLEHGIPKNLLFQRFNGFYDEPGTVGTISALLLSIDKFNLKKNINIPLLVAGILSFSLFFYVISLIYVLYILNNSYRIIITILFIGIVLFTQNNIYLEQYIYKRLEITGNTISGDNRMTKSGANYYERFKKTDDFLLGKGEGVSSVWGEGSSSYKRIIIDFGIVFLLVYAFALSWFTFAMIKNKKNAMGLIIIFLGILFQRPYIFNSFYVFLIYASIVYIAINSLNERLESK